MSPPSPLIKEAAGEQVSRLADDLERLLKSVETAIDHADGSRATMHVTRLRQARDEIERLRRDCAKLYQVIGCLAGTLRDNPQVIKALDNASAAAAGEPRPHDDLLPFTAVNPDAEDIASGHGEQPGATAEKSDG